MTNRALASIFISIGTLLVASSALADVLPSPPSNCPPGTVGKSAREGTWCEPTSCTKNADCPARRDWQYSISDREQTVTYLCQPAGLCASDQEMTRYVPHSGKVDTKITHRTAKASCTSDSDCGGGIKCETAPRCLEANRAFKDDGGGVYFFKPQTNDGGTANQHIPAPAASTSSMSVDASSTTAAGEQNVSQASDAIKSPKCACDLTTTRGAGGLSMLGFSAVFALLLTRRKRQ